MRQIAPKATTTSFRSMPDNVYVSGGEYFVKGTSRTGQPISSYQEDTIDEIFYDEEGRAYTLDPETGEKIYVSADPNTDEGSGEGTEDPNSPSVTDPNADPNNTTDPNNNQNPSGPSVDPTPVPDPDPTPATNPGENQTPGNPDGVVDDR